jgi:hypothetical protein
MIKAAAAVRHPAAAHVAATAVPTTAAAVSTAAATMTVDGNGDEQEPDGAQAKHCAAGRTKKVRGSCE